MGGARAAGGGRPGLGAAGGAAPAGGASAGRNRRRKRGHSRGQCGRRPAQLQRTLVGRLREAGAGPRHGGARRERPAGARWGRGARRLGLCRLDLPGPLQWTPRRVRHREPTGRHHRPDGARSHLRGPRPLRARAPARRDAGAGVRPGGECLAPAGAAGGGFSDRARAGALDAAAARTAGRARGHDFDSPIPRSGRHLARVDRLHAQSAHHRGHGDRTRPARG